MRAAGLPDWDVAYVPAFPEVTHPGKPVRPQLENHRHRTFPQLSQVLLP